MSTPDVNLFPDNVFVSAGNMKVYKVVCDVFPLISNVFVFKKERKKNNHTYLLNMPCCNKRHLQNCLECLDQAWANYGPGAICGLLSFLIWTAELRIILINLINVSVLCQSDDDDDEILKNIITFLLTPPYPSLSPVMARMSPFHIIKPLKR